MPAGFSIFSSSSFSAPRLHHLAGVWIAVFLILNPVIGVGHVAVEDVLTVLGIRLQVGRLQLLADELGIARCQILLQEAR
jgi:hypothetical protein